MCRQSCLNGPVRLADGCDESLDFFGILDATSRFYATADVNGKRAQFRHCTSDILRTQATTQNDPRPYFF